MKSEYRANSISLSQAVSMGTGVMIGAGIFTLLGQIAELSGAFFPFVFIAGAIVTAFSSYAYIKMSNAYPSSGGVAMILQKCYGSVPIAASAAVLMALSMILNESLVARTFATYLLRGFTDQPANWMIALIGVGAILFAYLLNRSGNDAVGRFSQLFAVIKIGGILLFAVAALAASGFSPANIASQDSKGLEGYIAATALAILAYKGFTTITNSGAEIVHPHKNVGRAIVISILICVVVYTLTAFAVDMSLPIDQIISAKDYALAQAAQPSLGQTGFVLTIILALVATLSGLVASIFAVSRMLTMLVNMKMIPHRQDDVKGSLRRHMLGATVLSAGLLTIFFDVTRMASMGAIFYLVMDMTIQWGVFKNMRRDVSAKGWILLSALALDGVVLLAFTFMKLNSDPMVVGFAIVSMIVVYFAERAFMKKQSQA